MEHNLTEGTVWKKLLMFAIVITVIYLVRFERAGRKRQETGKLS